MIQIAKHFGPYLGLLAAIVLSIMAIPTALDAIDASQNITHFKSTRATVTTHHEEKRKNGPDTYIVKFHYQIEQHRYHGTNQLTSWTDHKEQIEPLLRKEKSGQTTILVYYNPDKKKQVVIHKDIPLFPHIITILITLLAYTLSIYYIIVTHQKRRYLKKSRAQFFEST